MALLCLAATAARAESPALPGPTYDNTLYTFVYPPNVWNDTDFQTYADELLARVTPGPFARAGFADYLTVDMPWDVDLAAPVLSSPPRDGLAEVLTRAEDRGLAFHTAIMLGMSRDRGVYADAKREDRRNFQWYADGAVARFDTMSPTDAVAGAFVTPSRYARKLQRHMEAKVRAYAAMFLALRAGFPDTLISASGDAEAELAFDRADPAAPSGDPLLADYGPFAILEFRDWVLRAGLYAPGGPYAGQGYKKRRRETFSQGADALTLENLARFNAELGTAFSSWDLEYFHWDLTDPIDGDPLAIPFRRYKQSSWNPMPGSGRDHVPGGFDAPRRKDVPSRKFWTLWTLFRQNMVAHYTRDVAEWMTTTPGAGGETLSPDRWYSHQFPSDYLFATDAGRPTPHPRLASSASPLWTSVLPESLGSPGMTVLDVLGPAGYWRTSEYLFDAMEALGPRNWGMPEYSPAWPIEAAPETDMGRLTAQYRRVYGYGPHMFGVEVWPHFVETANGAALGAFLAEVRDQPRAAFWLPHDLFVRQLFLDLLGREPDPLSELPFWTTALRDGQISRAALAASLTSLPEAQRSLGLVTRYYLALLGRSPDGAGLATWTTYLQAGGCSGSTCRPARRRAVVAALVASDEFGARYGTSLSPEAFVDAMFQAILGRAPTPAELASRVGALDAGTSTRGEVARRLVESPAAGGRFADDVFVTLAYLGLLDRTPSDADLAAWRTRVAAGLARPALARIFLASDEYHARFE